MVKSLEEYAKEGYKITKTYVVKEIEREIKKEDTDCKEEIGRRGRFWVYNDGSEVLIGIALDVGEKYTPTKKELDERY